jgi:hypothetical protein
MLRFTVVVCLAALATSCAPMHRNTGTSAVRAEIEAAHEAAPERGETAAVEEQRYFGSADYNRERLTIEPIGMSAGMWSGGPYFGSAAGMSWRKWIAYKGFYKVSEPEFFRITGYLEEAKRAQGYYSGAVAEAIGGGVLATIGLVFLFSGYGASPIDWTQADIGYIAAGVGSILLWHGGMRLDQNWAPFDLAQGIANEYNAQLARQGPDD